MYDVVIAGERPGLAVGLGARDVTRVRQLPNGAADRVLAVGGKLRHPLNGDAPVVRQTEDQREQPLGFQAQPLVAEVVIGHHRVAVIFFYAKNGHYRQPP